MVRRTAKNGEPGRRRRTGNVAKVDRQGLLALMGMPPTWFNEKRSVLIEKSHVYVVQTQKCKTLRNDKQLSLPSQSPFFPSAVYSRQTPTVIS